MAIAQHVRKWLKATAIAANDFAGAVTGVKDGDLAQGPSGRIYVCTDTDNAATSVFARLALVWDKAGALVANDFAGSSLLVGDLGVDTVAGKLYICTASNGSTTSTWTVVGAQS
jgi:hypothetical protein